MLNRLCQACLFLAVMGAVMPCVASAADLPVLNLTMKNGRLYPDTLEAPASVRFKIIVRNKGPGPVELESRSLSIEKVLAAGAQSFVVVSPKNPGTYDLFDEFHPETGRGHVVVK